MKYEPNVKTYVYTLYDMYIISFKWRWVGVALANDVQDLENIREFKVILVQGVTPSYRQNFR